MANPKWQYFMHSTVSYITVQKILLSGKLQISNKNNYNYIQEAVYCHYIFDGLPDLKRWQYYDRFIIVLNPEVAKNLEMYVCDSVSYGFCKEDKESQVMHTKGKLQKMPSLQKIRDHILQKIEEASHNRSEFISSYIYSHEVLFPEIPIKYITAIFVPKQYGVKTKTNRRLADVQQEELEQYIANHNLNIKVIQYAKSNTNFYKYFEQI